MAINDAFQVRTKIGLTSGFANLFYMEISRWWKSKDWINQILLWTVIINLSLISILLNQPDSLAILSILGLFFGMFPSIAVVIIMAEVITGERKAGTVQWILSKPCSRSAFIASKLTSNAIGIAISMVYVPGLIAYIMIYFVGNIHYDIIAFLIGLSIVVLLMIFYMTFAIMLGTIYNQTGLVIGIPLLFNFGILSLLQSVRDVFNFVPHGLFFPITSDYTIFSSSVLRLPLDTITPIIVTLGLIFIFVGISFYKFNNEEF